MRKLTPGRTLYIRDPEKNYAFVQIGKIGYWERYGKAIWIDGRLYTMTPVQEGVE
jgi:hypothetical protein